MQDESYFHINTNQGKELSSTTAISSVHYPLVPYFHLFLNFIFLLVESSSNDNALVGVDMKIRFALHLSQCCWPGIDTNGMLIYICKLSVGRSRVSECNSSKQHGLSTCQRRYINNAKASHSNNATLPSLVQIRVV